MEAPVLDATLPDRLARAVTLAGPISLAQYMAAANAHYYATRDPLGSDFTTAPEISQMFGELIGAWLADLWDRGGRPPAAYVELGPGRGTLAADALRVMAKAGLTPPVHFVETSPTLRTAQAARVPDATWHDDTTTLPDDAALLIIANEFFDALPIRQLVRGGYGWHERLVACQDTLFLPIAGKQVPGDILPPELRDAVPGSVIETSPASVAVMRDLAGRIARQGGAMLTIDYGYEGPAIGDTLQAMQRGRFVNPFEHPGEHDLTAHVDFATLAAAAMTAGASAFGPVEQGALLVALGINARAAALGEAVAADRERLVAPDQMGSLFKALAITAPGWPHPAGFP
ncbi:MULTISPECIES: class I SAM-dependent methyltransferase [unclassified Sphingomonas]|uniref:class I SAM-dependent methyltransferase n=1 Tax=unclassified Sphingomonas TaxID=196159 RepID=UPI000BDB5921|nr:MAG: methyltransferase [Sphingomonas sp. 12-62-6]OYX38631.1 MAG: methyltransferase [Sphingomonas sp. 32-62-10]